MAKVLIPTMPLSTRSPMRFARRPLSVKAKAASPKVEASRRDAHLTGVAELLRHDHVERLLEVAIVEDQRRRVAAELHGHARHAVGAEAHEVLADAGGAGEADLADHAAGDERFAD